MKTVFSLVYFDCQLPSNNPLKDAIGPILFESKDEAELFVLNRVVERITESHADYFVNMVEEAGADTSGFKNDGEPFEFQELMSFIYADNEFDSKRVIDWFLEFHNDEETFFDFKIEELATKSFLEELGTADAIEIDGNFIRHFNLTSDGELESLDDIYLDASMVDDDCNLLEFSVTISEAQDAAYDAEARCWKVGDLDISVFKFA